MMTRAEHLAQCKRLALQLVATGELNDAFATMTIDLEKHPETANPALAKLGTQMLLAGFLSTPEKMRKWIEGYN
jgi:hypothetical protein